MKVNKDFLMQMNLPISNLRGQTYDTATTVLGHKSSVVPKQIKEEQPKALETNCHGHSLTLSVKETAASSTLMGTVTEKTMLVKYSPKFEQGLRLINQLQPGVAFLYQMKTSEKL